MTTKKNVLNFCARDEKQEDLDLKDINDYLEEKYEAYILLTCSKPSKSGKMKVEFTSSGDEILVEYLIDKAHNFISDEPISSMDSC